MLRFWVTLMLKFPYRSGTYSGAHWTIQIIINNLKRIQETKLPGNPGGSGGLIRPLLTGNSIVLLRTVWGIGVMSRSLCAILSNTGFYSCCCWQSHRSWSYKRFGKKLERLLQGWLFLLCTEWARSLTVWACKLGVQRVFTELPSGNPEIRPWFFSFRF